MYISTYIKKNKNFYQLSYRFQNFMSSWGSSKISKLQQVRDFSVFFFSGHIFNNYLPFGGNFDGSKEGSSCWLPHKDFFLLK